MVVEVIITLGVFTLLGVLLSDPLTWVDWYDVDGDEEDWFV